MSNIPLNTCIIIDRTKARFFPMYRRYAYHYEMNKKQRIITRKGHIYQWENGNWEPDDPVTLYEKIDHKNEKWALLYRAG